MVVSWNWETTEFSLDARLVPCLDKRSVEGKVYLQRAYIDRVHTRGELWEIQYKMTVCGSGKLLPPAGSAYRFVRVFDETVEDPDPRQTKWGYSLKEDYCYTCCDCVCNPEE